MAPTDRRVRVSTDWSFQGFPVVRLEGPLLRVDVVPRFGGKILQIEHRELGRPFLWHDPGQRLQSLAPGASYDDHFFGGWDELLPNDIPEIVGGEGRVDHGELWLTPLDARCGEAEVSLSGRLPITPLQFVKTVSILGPERLRVGYRIENQGAKPLDVLFKVHPALRISPGAEIHVPARRATVADPTFSRRGDQGTFDWPAGSDVIPPMDGTCEFLYLTDLARGECALAHREEDWRFRLSFDPKVFRSVWLFATYRGWRGLETLILEPCTTWPISIAEAARAGQCLVLAPGEILQTEVECVVGRYEGDRRC